MRLGEGTGVSGRGERPVSSPNPTPHVTGFDGEGRRLPLGMFAVTADPNPARHIMGNMRAEAATGWEQAVGRVRGKP